MFCPECGSMMFPVNGIYTCKSCNKQIEKTGEAKIVTTKSADKEMAVISEDVTTLPKTNHLCPKCGFNEAHYSLRQMRAADEPESRFFRCCKCNHVVRED